ncbi:MAG: hypothetical protein IH946_12800, partial [Bacteroidetes bacterium]|nr:hypothetical protein [Bacteroidota bacterium]
MKEYISKKLRAIMKETIREELESPTLLDDQAVAQKVLMNQYRLLFKHDALPLFDETGLSVFSQDDEDGKLLFIFALIGAISNTCLDIAF